jgi:hypothetical protein
VAQAFYPVREFSHSLERLCHQSEKLVGKDKPLKGERGFGSVRLKMTPVGELGVKALDRVAFKELFL